MTARSLGRLAGRGTESAGTAAISATVPAIVAPPGAGLTRTPSWLHGITIASVCLGMFACAQPSRHEEPNGGIVGDEAPAQLDVRLRLTAASAPDSIIGVLVQTDGPLDAEQREALEAAGLRIGTAVGDVVTGRIRAGDAPELLGLSFVRFVQQAARLEPLDPPRGHQRGPGPPTEARMP